jgi:hypothetical protein
VRSALAEAAACFAKRFIQLSTAKLAPVFARKYAARLTTEIRRNQKRDTEEHPSRGKNKETAWYTIVTSAKSFNPNHFFRLFPQKSTNLRNEYPVRLFTLP